MNTAEAVFLYLPLPYWAAFVVILYRHDLSRLFRPFRDGGSRRSWWLALNRLDLLGKERAAHGPGRKGEVLPYFVLLAVAAAVSLSWVLKIFPPFYYYRVIDQGVSAVVLTAATMRYLGQPPRRPYVDVLRYPRLGSRVRHLVKIPAGRQETKTAAGRDSRDGGAAGSTAVEVREATI